MMKVAAFAGVAVVDSTARHQAMGAAYSGLGLFAGGEHAAFSTDQVCTG